MLREKVANKVIRDQSPTLIWFKIRKPIKVSSKTLIKKT